MCGYRRKFIFVGNLKVKLYSLFFILFIKEFSEQSYSNIVSEQSTIPLLFACTASAKTVVANPLLHLSNLTHDILHAIISLDSPPHPDVQNNKASIYNLTVFY